jgi:hypothetical protein
MLPTFALQHHRWGLRRPAALDAVHRAAGVASAHVLHSQLERRHRRGHEVELANRAQIFAEVGAREDQIDNERGRKVCEDEICRGARQRPEIEQLVAEQHRDKQRDADPFRAEPSREAKPGRPDAATRVANEYERTARAEQVAGGEQRDHQQPAIVHPRQDGRKVGRIDSRTQ